jgi:putative phage-type endonuclease
MNAPSDFLARRTRGIGGSDISAVLGLNKWKTPMQLYLDKTGQSVPTPDNDAMYWGRTLEDIVAREFATRKDLKIQRINEQLAHVDQPWAIANIDRAVINPAIAGNVRIKDGRLTTDQILECKTANGFASKEWGESGTDYVPDAYLLQVQWYLHVTQCDIGHLAVLIGGSDFRTYVIERDQELIDDCVQAATEFWHGNVLAKNPPPPSSYDEAAAKWSQHIQAKSRIVDVSIAQACAELKDLQAKAKEIDAAIDEKKLIIASAFEDAETITCAGDVLGTWKTQEAARLDSKALKAAHPEIAAQYTTTTSTRALRIK